MIPLLGGACTGACTRAEPGEAETLSNVSDPTAMRTRFCDRPTVDGVVLAISRVRFGDGAEAGRSRVFVRVLSCNDDAGMESMSEMDVLTGDELCARLTG